MNSYVAKIAVDYAKQVPKKMEYVWPEDGSISSLHVFRN
jgi:hypothetical protein